MRFSIVITTYNRLSLLKRAIASALAQTVPCEVVVVDNCSSDGTEEYVRSLGNQVVYRRNPSNLGHSGAVNVGVRLAKGDWVKLVDDDDFLAPNCVESMTQAIALRLEAALCSCQAVQVDANGEELSRTRQVGPGQVFYIPQEDIHYGMLLEQVPFGTPIQVAFRRDAFLESGGWDTSLTSCDDIDSWIRIAKYGDAIFINQCLTYRTVWPGGYDHRIALETRMNTNILMKERIHALVNEKYHSAIPTIQDIRNYLRLHWGLVALKQRKIVDAYQMALSATVSPVAWKLLIGARKGHQLSPAVRKVVLLDSQPSANTAMLIKS